MAASVCSESQRSSLPGVLLAGPAAVPRCGVPPCLQSFGLAVLMAKAGLAVPAAAPVALPCYGSVLADIGDEQSLSASLSTFSGHLRRIEVSKGNQRGAVATWLQD